MVFSSDPEGRIDIDLARGIPSSDALYSAMVESQSTRSTYDGKTMATGDLKLLEESARVEEVSTVPSAKNRKRKALLESVIQGNSAQVTPFSLENANEALGAVKDKTDNGSAVIVL